MGVTTIDAHLTDNGLVLEDRAKTVRKVCKDYISPSSAHTLAGGCAASWAADRLGPRNADPMSPANTGTIVHAVMEALYGLPAERRTPEAAMNLWTDCQTQARTRAAEAGLVFTDSQWHEHFAHYDAAVLAVFDESYIDTLPSDTDVVATERSVGSFDASTFTITPVPAWGVPVYGVVDRIDRRADGRLVMRDYKLKGLKNGTVAAMPDAAHLERFGDPYGHQQRIYAAALNADGTGELAEARLLFLGTREQRRIDLGQEAMSVTRDLLTSTWNGYRRMCEARTFEYKTGPLCGFCPLAEVCPAAAREGRGIPSPRRTSEPLGVLSTPVRMAPSTTGDMREPIWADDKPYIDHIDNAPNAAAYGAATAFGMVTLAWESLEEAGRPLRSRDIHALAATFHAVIVEAAAVMIGANVTDVPLNSGAVTRCSGALRTYLASRPVPLDGTSEQIARWAAQATRACTTIACVAHDLTVSGYALADSPWRQLATAVDKPNQKVA